MEEKKKNNNKESEALITKENGLTISYKKNNKESEALITKENGLTISYKKNQFNEYFPTLLEEITGNKKKIKIESIESDLNPPSTNRTDPIPNELMYPGAIDFIRRCSTKEEAISILDFLLKRREI
ncbi:MAG: hypothetical protein ACXAES_13820, partial [Promethearchaeota archaeon]